ncbi:hypothetical protein ACU8KH_01692 [Lachancea thermotolerans]
MTFQSFSSGLSASSNGCFSTSRNYEYLACKRIPVEYQYNTPHFLAGFSREIR